MRREERLLRSQHPSEPWLWRRDWAARTANDVGSRHLAGLWAFTLAWNLISVPGALLFRERADRDPMTLFVMVFPVIGAILILVSLYQTLRRRKYGISVCRFDSLPIPVGSTLRGEVQVHLAEGPQEGFNVRLTCMRRMVTGSGKNRNVKESALWQEEQRVGSGAVMPNPNGLRVPFHFVIPEGSEPADDREPNDRVIWRLEVTADVPGIDYRGVFELPVFTTAAFADAIPAAPISWTPPPSIIFGMSRTGGEEVTIKPSSRPLDFVTFGLFLPVWFGALWLIYRAGAPILFIAFFGLIGFFVLFLALDFLAGLSTVSADRSQLTYKRTFFGTRVIPSVDVRSIETRIGSTVGGRAFYDLEAQLQNGSSVTIARNLRQRRDAEMLAERINRALGSSRR